MYQTYSIHHVLYTQQARRILLDIESHRGLHACVQPQDTTLSSLGLSMLFANRSSSTMYWNLNRTKPLVTGGAPCGGGI
jgi:hypothetical protein